MTLDNNPQVLPTAPVNKNGANSSTDPTYNVRMLMDAENSALRELAMSEIRHVEEMQKLHVKYQEQLTVAESKRIDAILKANTDAQATDRERATAQAQVLATQVATSAETLRSLVATTAQATATQYQQSHNQIAERVTQLEKARYEGVGRSTIEDPLLSAQTNKMEAMLTSMSESKGKAGLSAPLLMMIAGLVGGMLVWIIQTIIK
jgi:hypothetical protein